MRTELALRRVTEVFAMAERRRFALQIAENFAHDLRTVEDAGPYGLCAFLSLAQSTLLKTFFFFQKTLDKPSLPCYNSKAF
jgi:hypothetical protein